jgi:hypothetical protein
VEAGEGDGHVAQRPRAQLGGHLLAAPFPARGSGAGHHRRDDAHVPGEREAGDGHIAVFGDQAVGALRRRPRRQSRLDVARGVDPEAAPRRREHDEDGEADEGEAAHGRGP